MAGRSQLILAFPLLLEKANLICTVKNMWLKKVLYVCSHPYYFIPKSKVLYIHAQTYKYLPKSLLKIKQDLQI